MYNFISKSSYLNVTGYAYSIFFTLFYLIKFYTDESSEQESNEIYNLIFFQMISYFLLFIFSLINPLYIFSVCVRGVEKRKSQNKKYFDIKGINVISLDKKITPYLITLIFTVIALLIIFVILWIIVFIFPVTVYFFKFPFQINSNISNLGIYYGVYGFLFLNIIYSLLNPKESTKIYFLNFSVSYWSIFVAFVICAFFILFHMIFYFSYEDVTSTVLENKSKIAYAMWFNFCFLIIDYLKDKKAIFNDEKTNSLLVKK